MVSGLDGVEDGLAADFLEQRVQERPVFVPHARLDMEGAVRAELRAKGDVEIEMPDHGSRQFRRWRLRGQPCVVNDLFAFEVWCPKEGQNGSSLVKIQILTDPYFSP